MPNTGNRLLNFWADQPAPSLQLPVSQQEIGNFEKSNSIFLPDDFKNYLNHVNGFSQDENYQDGNGFNFWPIDKIRRVSEYDEGKWDFSGADTYFIFCDYLDLCWAYAIQLTSDIKENKVVMVGTRDSTPIVVSKDFSEFVDLYLRDDERLYKTSQ